MSSYVWKDVAPRLADTGRFEVFAPTMAGHNGGPPSRSWFLDTTTLANHVEAQLDELGWTTAHVVGNSLGGWVAFELERRGRARTLTAIAPAGGWHRWSPVKYEIVAKFVAGAPVWLTALLLGKRALRLPLARQAASVPISATPAGLSDPDLLEIIDDVTHCRAYYQLLIKALLLPGLMELTETTIPTNLVILRTRPRAAAPAVHQALPQTHPGDRRSHQTRWRRPHSDVRGAGEDRRPDHHVGRRAHAAATAGRPPRGLAQPACAPSSVVLNVLLGRITAVVFSRSG